jgi:penicillin amidase
MRWVKRISVFLVIVALAAAAYGVFTVRRSFPQVNGQLAVGGLDSNVEVLRDELGVPHIYASSQHDLFFAQGYTHAQDRFWQMDFWRHIGSGRLAEMFGESQVETDMFLRSLGFEDLAEAEWDAMGSPAREILQAYAEGVNAYLATHSGAEVSLEYAILPLQNSGYEVEPWSPTDTLMWPKVMAWDLGGNMDAEIDRAVLGRQVEPERVDQLYPPMPEDKPVIIEPGQSASVVDPMASVPLPDGAIDALIEADERRGLVMAVTGGGFEGIGSNNWVAGGSMTVSGLPLLANDTHLANQMPSIWYANGLHCLDCGFDVVGFSFPGTPTVGIGHNGHHAWGVTNQAADTQDLFIERVDPDDPSRYEVDGEWTEFETRSETIVVAGGDDVTYEVRSTRHGPVISGTYVEEDVFDESTTAPVPDDYVVAMAWKALEPSSIIEAFIGINRAASPDELASAVASWDIAPQNLVYADVDGNIGYFATGALPVRAAGDGRYPVPGWSGEFDWVATVAPEEMPRLLNPPQGFVQSANQSVLRPGSSPFIGADSALGYRADRIVALLETTQEHDVSSMQQMQMDSRDGGAEAVIPYLLALDAGGEATVETMQERLEGWSTGVNSLQASGRSAGAAVYMAVWRHLLAQTFHDELPEEQWPTGGSRWFEVIRNLLEESDDPWWDDVTTPAPERRDDILLTSMRAAHEELSDLLGEDDDTWAWGDLHIAHFENQTLGQSGIGPVEWLFNRTAPARVGGSESVVNAVGWSTDQSYLVDWVPSQRMVIDLADLDVSTFVHTTGQSGHAFHGNYDSMIELWVDGDHGPMPWSREAVEAVTADRLDLVPEN